MAVLALNTSVVPQRGEPSAPRSFAGDVARPVAAAAGVGSADHFDHQRRASAELAEWRSRGLLRSVSAARLARALQRSPKIWEQVKEIPDEELLEVHRRRKRRLVTFVRERQTASAHPAARLGRGSALRGRSARSRTRSPSASRAGSPLTSAPRCCSAMSSG